MEIPINAPMSTLAFLKKHPRTKIQPASKNLGRSLRLNIVIACLPLLTVGRLCSEGVAYTCARTIKCDLIYMHQISYRASSSRGSSLSRAAKCSLSLDNDQLLLAAGGVTMLYAVSQPPEPFPSYSTDPDGPIRRLEVTLAARCHAQVRCRRCIKYNSQL